MSCDGGREMQGRRGWVASAVGKGPIIKVSNRDEEEFFLDR